jgi:hypothetical protein
MAEQYTLQDWIIAIAMNDDAFRQHLLRDPKEALERELGLSVPQEVRIQVHEQTSTTLHLVLPTKAEGIRV